MSFHRLLPSISFLKSDRRISAGSPHPLGATWDGRGTNFALFSANAEKVELCLFDKTGRQRDRPHRAAGAHRGRLARLSARRAARPALRLSRARPLRPRGRAPLQSAQAADRSLQPSGSAASSPGPTRISPIASATSARTCRSTAATTRASMLEVGGGRPGPHLGRRPASAGAVGRHHHLRGARQRADAAARGRAEGIARHLSRARRARR